MKPTSKKILVIEDDAHIAEGLRLNLTLKGYQVAVAGDGPSGLQEWKTLRPDLIVLDIMLPGIDGLSVLRSIFNPHLRAELGDLISLMFQLSSQQTGLAYPHDFVLFE